MRLKPPWFFIFCCTLALSVSTVFFRDAALAENCEGSACRQSGDIKNRVASLKQTLNELNKQIRQLDELPPADAEEKLDKAQFRLARLRSQFDKIRGESNSTSEDFAVWESRAERLAKEDIASVALEIAPNSESLGKTLSEYNTANQEYARLKRDLQLKPDDNSLKNSLAEIDKTRSKLLESLTRQVSKIIAEKRGQLGKSAGSLSSAEKELQQQLKQEEDTVAYLSAVLNPDRAARKEKKTELIKQRDQVKRELSIHEEFLLQED